MILDDLIDNCLSTLNSIKDMSADDAEGEIYVDIRLQYLEGGLHLYWGDSRYDRDHRGTWAYSSIRLEAQREEVEKVIAELYCNLMDSLKSELEIDCASTVPFFT